MRRIRLTLAYDGTDFYGWQVQPELPTVQGVLEGVLEQIEGKPVTVAGSGRTDAGVHARGQVAGFSLENPIPLENLRRAMNRLLPASIRVLQAAEAAESFHPRFDAVAKTYEYRIFQGEICPPFEWRYVLHYPYPLHVARMQELAAAIEGEHDFTAFAAADEQDAAGRSKVRRIYSSRLETDGERLVYRVRGSGFLKHMVRNLCGMLLEGGKGNLDLPGLRNFLLPGAKGKAGPTAPAKGLTLVSVEYQ